MSKRLLLVLGASLWLSAALAGQALTGASEDDPIFGLGKTHRVRVSVSPQEWEVLQTSGGRGVGTPAGTPITGGIDFRQPDGRLVHVGSGFRALFPWVHADLLLNDVELKEIGLRYKGNNSFVKPSPARPFSASLKVKTDLFGGKADWHGAETLNFHAGARDPSLIREAMAFAIFRAAGVPASRTAYAELTFNVPGLHDNAPGGTFVVVENVNKRFLKRVLPPGTGLLMKPEGTRGGVQSLGSNWDAYIPVFRPDREATTHEQERVMEFAGLISQTDVALFRERIGTYLDVDEFLRFVAVHLFIANNDSYIGGGNHNYYLYLDPKDDKIRFIPWDEDLSMNSGRGGNGPDILRPVINNNALIYWLLDDPMVAERYRAILKELAETVFTEDSLNKLLEEVERAIPNRDPSTKNFLKNRAAQIQSAVATLP
jgi:spore coat protein CotH